MPQNRARAHYSTETEILDRDEMPECKSNMVTQTFKHVLGSSAARHTAIKCIHFFCFTMLGEVREEIKTVGKNEGRQKQCFSMMMPILVGVSTSWHVIFEECNEESENRKFICSNNWMLLLYYFRFSFRQFHECCRVFDCQRAKRSPKMNH